MAAQNQKPAGDSFDPLIMMVAVALIWAMAYLFWERFHAPIATGYSWLRVVQFSPFVLLDSIWAAIAGGVLMAIGGAVAWTKRAYSKYGIYTLILGGAMVVGYLLGALFTSWFGFFRDSDKSQILWSHMTRSSMYANLFTLVVGVVPFAVWMVRKSLATNITNHKHHGKAKDYTLHSFTDRMGEHHPHLALFRKIDLTSRSINAGKYRMTDTEKQFAIKHRLLDRVKGNEFKVNRNRATALFAGQMRKLWTGYEGLSRWELAVMAVLLPRVAATDPAMPDDAYKAALARSKELLEGYWRDAAASYDTDKDTLKLNLKLARETIKQYRNSTKVKAFFNAHAYVGTILYAMLIEARTLGVLQPAEFRWLRVVDRHLWTVIDNVGRIVAATECAAIYSHFLNELSLKRGIEKPMIDNAVRGLIEGVESYAFSPDEIAEINALLRAEEERLAIERDMAAKERRNLILMIGTAGVGPTKGIFEVALLAENGESVFEQRCKPDHPVDLEAWERYRLSDDEIEKLANLPSVAEVRTKLLELCNGHNVATFDKGDFAMVPGLERSAAQLSECRGDERMSLQAEAVMHGVLREDEVVIIQSAKVAAELCLKIWVQRQKDAIKAQVKAP